MPFTKHRRIKKQMARYGQQSQTWTQSILQALAARQLVVASWKERLSVCIPLHSQCHSHIPHAFLRKDSSSNLAEDLKILKTEGQKCVQPVRILCKSYEDADTSHFIACLVWPVLNFCKLDLVFWHLLKLDVLTDRGHKHGARLVQHFGVSVSFAEQLHTTYILILLI